MSELGTPSYVGHTRQVGGCQTDAGELVLLGEGCAVVQPRYPLYLTSRVGETRSKDPI